MIAQLAVGTGFESNPHDYIEVDATRAFVSRYGTNPTPGQQAFDTGGDLLIVDTTKYAITGRIAMPEENPALQPCPDGMNWIGADVVVTLQRFSADFSQVGDGRFVGVSPATNAIDWTVNITGLQNCGRVVRLSVGQARRDRVLEPGEHDDERVRPGRERHRHLRRDARRRRPSCSVSASAPS